MRIISENRKATFSYSIQETFDAGIVLVGSEVKALRESRASLFESYIIHSYNELYIKNMHVSIYKFAASRNHDPKRLRKLLLRKKEITKIINFLKIGGNAVIPLNIYFNDNNLVKIKIGTAKGKNLRDKREDIKKREWNREKNRILTKNNF